MTVELSRSDFNRLSQIVQNLPDFANVRDRRRLIAGALEGTPKTDLILARLDLDGSPMGVAVEVIRFLCQFGQVAYHQEALHVFLNYIQPFTRDDDAAFLNELFQRYPLDVPASPNRLIDLWRGGDSIVEFQEKIIGENTLRHVYTLQLALEASKAVARLRTPANLGTGFMIAPNLLMTNNHVLASRKQAEQTEYAFNYQLDSDGRECKTQTVRAIPGGTFYTNRELDYTLVEIESADDAGNPLMLKNQLLKNGDRVAIIQHPSGHLKKISLQNNFVVYADPKVVQYTTSTEPGSSGSPVFDDHFNVVAIHHSGGLLTEPGTERRYLRNAGTSMMAILADLKSHKPQILRLLTGQFRNEY